MVTGYCSLRNQKLLEKAEAMIENKPLTSLDHILWFQIDKCLFDLTGGESFPAPPHGLFVPCLMQIWMSNKEAHKVSCATLGYSSHVHMGQTAQSAIRPFHTERKHDTPIMLPKGQIALSGNLASWNVKFIWNKYSLDYAIVLPAFAISRIAWFRNIPWHEKIGLSRKSHKRSEMRCDLRLVGLFSGMSPQYSIIKPYCIQRSSILNVKIGNIHQILFFGMADFHTPVGNHILKIPLHWTWPTIALNFTCWSYPQHSLREKVTCDTTRPLPMEAWTAYSQSMYFFSNFVLASMWNSTDYSERCNEFILSLAFSPSFIRAVVDEKNHLSTSWTEIADCPHIDDIVHPVQ